MGDNLVHIPVNSLPVAVVSSLYHDNNVYDKQLMNGWMIYFHFALITLYTGNILAVDEGFDRIPDDGHCSIVYFYLLGVGRWIRPHSCLRILSKGRESITDRLLARTMLMWVMMGRLYSHPSLYAQ